MSTSHPWQFFRIGGCDQAALTTAADLENLHTLDQKLWTALSCPVKGLELDEKTLALIDTDNDGRIRVPELLAAIAWSKAYFADLAVLLGGNDTLALSAFASTAEGKSALVSSKRILASLGKSSATSISLSDASDIAKLFAATTFNGDGVIIPASTDQPALVALITDIVAATGGVTDRSGTAGVNQALLDCFFAESSALSGWAEKAAAADVLTLGAGTAAATAAVATVRAKVDDYFARSRLAAFDARATSAVNRPESEYVALAAKDLTNQCAEIAAFPLAHVVAGQALPLLVGVNPAWAAALTALQRDAVSPAFGATTISLTEAQWLELKAKTDVFAAHAAAKPATSVEKLGLEKIRAYLADAEAVRGPLAQLFAQDSALAPEFDAIVNVEKLLRYARDFRTLLHNFVNFFDFYSPERLATFQAGTLYLDTRATALCFEVAGPNPLAAMSKMFIAYCDIKRPGFPPRKIAACFTNGDSDYLFVGRNGLFYDRQGRDWDATITSLADNPISIRQAFFAPYKKFLRAIEEQVAKRAAAAEAESNAKLAATADKAANVDKLVVAPPAPPKKMDIGSVAAISLVVTGIVGVFTTIVGYVFDLVWWQYPLVIVGLMLAISGPSMLIAWLKLRQRTIGPILEGNGWAVNGRVKVNIPFGTRLTDRAILPAGSNLNLNDPYIDKDAARRRRSFFVCTLLVLLMAGMGFAWYAKVWPFAPKAASSAPAAAPAAPATP